MTFHKQSNARRIEFRRIAVLTTALLIAQSLPGCLIDVKMTVNRSSSLAIYSVCKWMWRRVVGQGAAAASAASREVVGATDRPTDRPSLMMREDWVMPGRELPMADERWRTRDVVGRCRNVEGRRWSFVSVRSAADLQAAASDGGADVATASFAAWSGTVWYRIGETEVVGMYCNCSLGCSVAVVPEMTLCNASTGTLNPTLTSVQWLADMDCD